MARPSVVDNPVFVECANRLAPLDEIMVEAKKVAAATIEAAKLRVKNERLAVVRFAIENGLSQYAVGKLTGVTTSADQKALIAEAMGTDWQPVAGPLVAPVVQSAEFADAGWTATLQNVAGDPWRAEWLVQHPNGETGLFASYPVTGGDFAVDAVDYERHHVWKLDMPDAVLYGMLDWRPL